MLWGRDHQPVCLGRRLHHVHRRSLATSPISSANSSQGSHAVESWAPCSARCMCGILQARKTGKSASTCGNVSREQPPEEVLAVHLVEDPTSTVSQCGLHVMAEELENALAHKGGLLLLVNIFM